jgi:hypothetical protein
MAHIIYRVDGDEGESARIRFRLVDRNGVPVDSGSVTLRVDGLFEASATAEGSDGWWFYDPQPGDIVWNRRKPGRLLMDAVHDGATLPAQDGAVFVVRRRAQVEEEPVE